MTGWIILLMSLGATAEALGVGVIGFEIRRTRRAVEDYEEHEEFRHDLPRARTTSEAGRKLGMRFGGIEILLREITEGSAALRRTGFILLLVGIGFTFAANLWALLS
jgi:hypothetical protein